MLTRRIAQLRRGLLVPLLAMSIFAGAASAQDRGVDWDPRSGDVWVDTWMGDMNHYGTRYREPFIDELVRYHGAPRPLVVELLETRRWAPGDVYYACALASVIGRPCRHVVDLYEADRGQGWGVVAKRLGIKPGSPEFHRLKKGFVPTYDRWARPIDLDDDLRRDFPNRGKGKGGASSSKKAASATGGPVSAAKADRGPPAAKGGPARDDRGGKGGKEQGQKDQKKGKGNGKP